MSISTYTIYLQSFSTVACFNRQSEDASSSLVAFWGSGKGQSFCIALTLTWPPVFGLWLAFSTCGCKAMICVERHQKCGVSLWSVFSQEALALVLILSPFGPSQASLLTPPLTTVFLCCKGLFCALVSVSRFCICCCLVHLVLLFLPNTMAASPDSRKCHIQHLETVCILSLLCAVFESVVTFCYFQCAPFCVHSVLGCSSSTTFLVFCFVLQVLISAVCVPKQGCLQSVPEERYCCREGGAR